MESVSKDTTDNHDDYMTPKKSDTFDYTREKEDKLHEWMRQKYENKEKFSWGLTGGTKKYEDLMSNNDAQWFKPNPDAILITDYESKESNSLAIQLEDQSSDSMNSVEKRETLGVLTASKSMDKEKKNKDKLERMYASPSLLRTKPCDLLVESTFVEMHSRNPLLSLEDVSIQDKTSDSIVMNEKNSEG